MAIMIPSKPFETGSRGEKDLFLPLKTNLLDEYFVLHSLKWVGGQYQIEGEVDFAIIHPRKGILLIEVKSGIIEYKNRILVQTNRHTGEEKEIDPIAQLRASKHKLARFVNSLMDRDSRCSVGYAVWFPSYSITGILPPDITEEIFGDANLFSDPLKYVEKSFDYWYKLYPTKMSDKIFTNLLKNLCGEFSIAPSLKSDYEYREQQFIRLTNEQARILDFLEEQQKAIISGIAGTGKTLIAMEKCRRLALKKQSVLFVCFNRFLAAYLKNEFSDSWLEITTFHGLATQFVPAASYNDMDQLESLFIEKLLKDEIKLDYKHIIVDEGQDFKNEWIDILELQNAGTFYIFYDKYQNIFRDEIPEWQTRAECKLTLTKNCRNTKQISKTSLKMVNIPFDKYISDSVEGPKPFIMEINNLEEGYDYIKNIALNHVQELGGKYSDIVVLTLVSEEKSLFKDIARFTQLPISGKLEKNKVTFTTARKFKGLEGDIVIIVDMDWSNYGEQNWNSLIYVSSTRARHELHYLVLGNNNELYSQVLTKALPDRKIVKDKSRFASHFQIQFKGSDL